ncbi:MAG: sulfite exporter TauE/SafE family protein [Planctomycetes bacterium]|nr:sulfite exporter TauE/SafE family protein [Planctomycetota bacterium]
MTLGEAFLTGAGLGIAGAVHCAAMCGVFALRAAAATSGAAAFLRFASYLGGKTFTYVFLGSIAGYFGSRFLDDSSDWRAWLGVGAAAVMLVVGLLGLLPRRSASSLAGFLGPVIQPLVRALGGHGSSGFTLGALTGLLPCGLVYLAALQAAVAGSVLNSAVLMAAFGLGTMPALIVVGTLGGGLHRRGWLGPVGLRIAGAILLIAMGAVALWRALGPLLAEPGAAPCCH